MMRLVFSRPDTDTVRADHDRYALSRAERIHEATRQGSACWRIWETRVTLGALSPDEAAAFRVARRRACCGRRRR